MPSERIDRGLPPQVVRALDEGAGKVGRYLKIERLGRGGAGVVWKSWDTMLRRWVALKVIFDPERAELLHREARLAAGLQHRHIAQVYESGVDGDTAYIAIQYIEGRSLAESNIPLRDGVAAVRDAARALQHAHERGIVHRDVKPSNIMVDPVGQTIVLDFGLARHAAAASPLSATGRLVGTPYYMSPEQARGSHDVGPAADVYGLGATLYYVVSRRHPFEAESVLNVLQRVVLTDLPKLDAPRDLNAIVRKAMEKDPRRRYPSAQALSEDLDRFLLGEPVRARPPGVVSTAVRGILRHPALAGAAVAGVIAVVAVIGVLLQRVEMERRQRVLSDVHRIGAEIGRWDQALRDPPHPLGPDQEALRGHVEALRRIGREHPDLPETHFYIGWAQTYLNRHEAAIDSFTRAIELGFSNGRAYDARAEARLLLAQTYTGPHAKAAQEDRVRKLQAAAWQDIEQARFLGGVDADRLDQHAFLLGAADAEPCRELAQHAVNDPVWWELAGRLHLAASEWTDALAAYRKAVEILRSSTRLRVRVAEVLMYLRRYEEAREELAVADDLDPEDPMHLAQTALTYLSEYWDRRQGVTLDVGLDAARAACAIDETPMNVYLAASLSLQMAVTAFEAGDDPLPLLRESLGWYERIRALDPTSGQLVEVGFLHGTHMRFLLKHAPVDLERVRQLEAEVIVHCPAHSTDGSAHYYRGLGHLYRAEAERAVGNDARGVLAQAHDAFTRSLAGSPTEAPRLRGRGTCRFSLGRYAEAAEDWEAAVASDPSTATELRPKIDETRRLASEP